MARRPAVALLVLVAAVLIVLGLPLQHLHGVTRPAAFADHAAALSTDPVVRDALSDAAVEAVVDAVEDVSPAAGPAARAVVAPRADRVVASAAFRRAFRGTARRGLRQVVDADRRRVTFTVTDVAGLTTETTGALPAELDRLLRSVGPVPIFSFARGHDAAARTARLEQLGAAGLPLLVGAGVLLLLAIAVAPVRRTTVRACGLAVLGSAAVVVAAEQLARALTLGAAGSGQDRDVAAAVWDELLSGLRTEALVLVALGLVVALGATVLGRPRAAGRPAYPLG
ncbi:hypothetical protein [Patulibacter sp.]|uniref:hypothetical protein n=1 Tax=Patulibacter sp. TaxID=1912859 RepID=UPI00271F7F28|nr:hypothetical protein [Patulibacter sp.]MDO9407087.1 hypothetical protein [Patulibacter sp.]